MDSNYLMKQVDFAFHNVELGNNYTLAEEDYADTSYWYFDKTHPDSNLTEEEWRDQESRFIETGGWLSADQTEALQAIEEKRKMINRFSNPLDIPILYLNCYSSGFSYLKPQAYLFYTPAIMKNFLEDQEVFYTNSFTSWLDRLTWANSLESILDLIRYFSKDQIEVLQDFLLYVLSSVVENDDVKIALDNLKLIRKM
ncbi:hypothetical protein [Acinetobacter higginsii]|uniref:hypothetical protein n=1 Tax=Acinetobacter higginsii TaxID=70347 RepID=UPI002675004B|nr:hypothetical protein [Acinetobacter higginsii]MDO3665354.1 hypothetical protein [Acinetobacter higginsii]